MLFVAVFAFIACDPVQENIGNGGHISVDELKALSERMISSTKSDRLKAIASMFKIYAEKNNGKVTLDLINKAISFAERAKDNAVLKQILTLRVDYYEQKKQPLYAMMDRERIRAL